MFYFWMCFVKGIIQGVDRSLWFISWNVWSAWWHNIVVFVVFVFSTWNGFGKSWLNLQVWEHGQRVLVIGHALSESHSIWIHHFHLSPVAGSWLKATSWEAKALKYRIQLRYFPPWNSHCTCQVSFPKGNLSSKRCYVGFRVILNQAAISKCLQLFSCEF